ncbi:MAG: Omp28-related outer membrane protein [Crocinitomicaceae bacterium]|nr:Omp28-related outer membrane protein [Flavobacteriales bacterium]NQZ36221.1 Omp28-related outer membrane protein [Crocinitomicaceae bacterium]
MKNLLLCGSLLLAGSAFSQVLTEDFEGLGGALPTGWASVSTTPGTGDYITGDASVANAAAYWPVPASSDFAMVNDDVCNCDLSAAYLVTPSMDFTGLSGVVVTYDFVDDITYGPSLPHEVEVSIDGGTSWTSVYTYVVDNGNLNWQNSLVPLGAATDGASSVMVRWFYNDGGTWATGIAIDNVVVKEPAQNDASLTGVSVDRWALINSNTVLTAEVTNVGGNAITSLEIDWNDGTSHVQTITVNIAPGASASVAHPTNVTYATAVEENIAVTITAVNATTDGDPSNNAGSALHNTLSQQTDKAVVFEEGTGTWCGWCPRGAVAMDYMSATYPADFIGVAVHNGDPMTLAAYDGGAGISGFPGANVDRALLGVGVSQTAFEGYYNDRVNMGVPANIVAAVSGTGANVTIDVSANFYTPVSGADFRLAVVIAEDGVTGTSAAYNQANYYSGGAQGPMGGYEGWADPVPAADMVYDHVGVALLGGYDGQAGSVPATIADGTVANYSFTYTVPGTSNRDNMHAVALLIDNATGEIVNAKEVSISESGSVADVDAINMNVFPNPATDNVNVAFEAAGDYTITITDMSGRVVSTNVLSNLSGAQNIAIPVADLMSGNYIISVANDAASYNQVLVIK